MNPDPERELAAQLGYEVDFAALSKAGISEPAVAAFVTCAANMAYARSTVTNEDSALGEAMDAAGDPAAERWASVHLGLAADFEARAAAAVEAAQPLVSRLVELGILVAR